MPEQAAIHSPVLHAVLARRDKTEHAVFGRLMNGETPEFLRVQGRTRYHSFPDTEDGTGACLANGSLIVSKIGRIAGHWRRWRCPVEGTRKAVTVSKEAAGWSVCFSCAQVPRCSPSRCRSPAVRSASHQRHAPQHLRSAPESSG